MQYLFVHSLVSKTENCKLNNGWESQSAHDAEYCQDQLRSQLTCHLGIQMEAEKLKRTKTHIVSNGQ